jgi:antitoxin component YwqK of YwqJK toxin-antitoxin module
MPLALDRYHADGRVVEMNLDDPETLAKVVAEAIDDEKLERVGEKGEELLYARNHHRPYAGWCKKTYDDGALMNLAECQDGKMEGLSVGWNNKGWKEEESTWKDGKILNYVTFKPNGEKCPETNIVNGNGSLVLYNDDGSVAARGTCTDGKVEFGAKQVDARPPPSKKKGKGKRKRKSGKKFSSPTSGGMMVNCLPPFAFIWGLVYCLEKYWGMDVDDPDSSMVVILLIAFWGFAVGWIYLVDFIKKRMALR